MIYYYSYVRYICPKHEGHRMKKFDLKKNMIGQDWNWSLNLTLVFMLTLLNYWRLVAHEIKDRINIFLILIKRIGQSFMDDLLKLFYVIKSLVPCDVTINNSL